MNRLDVGKKHQNGGATINANVAHAVAVLGTNTSTNFHLLQQQNWQKREIISPTRNTNIITNRSAFSEFRINRVRHRQRCIVEIMNRAIINAYNSAQNGIVPFYALLLVIQVQLLVVAFAPVSGYLASTAAPLGTHSYSRARRKGYT